MQHPLQISRKIEYGLRAMLFLAAQPEGSIVPFRAIAQRMEVPEEFLAKILKTLVRSGLASSSRGSRGGYALGRPASEITFLDVIEAVEGPVHVNVCTEGVAEHQGCSFSGACTMYGVWRLGQERMLEVYKNARLDRLAMRGLKGELDAQVH
ncbi:MAG: Rrf2 family transcriptional regulator [Myxococcaceae bacterium]|nr:Rrf2 family transcriptional regulator [Myxococcaceae bacterium]